jgi:hypothetical protein
MCYIMTIFLGEDKSNIGKTYHHRRCNCSVAIGRVVVVTNEQSSVMFDSAEVVVMVNKISPHYISLGRRSINKHIYFWG